MITKSGSYFAVCCARCSKLIVTSAEDVTPKVESTETEDTLHVFVAKCKRCGFEGAYTVRPFQRFDVESCEC